MVKKFLEFLQKEVSGLHEAAYLLGTFALLSQLTALVRDRILAASFGAGGVLDIYYAAFRIPDFIFVSVGSMVSIAVLVPFFTAKMAEGNGESTRKFIDDIFSIFLLTIIILSAIVFVFTPYLLPRLLPGFAESPSLPHLVTITRIMLLSPIFLGISNFLSSITQIHNRFFIYATSPIVYNVGIIIGATILYPLFGVAGLAMGVALGALMHFAIQIPFIAGKGFLPRLRFSIDFSSIKKVIFLSFPRTLTLSSNQIAMFFLIAFASLMATGSIAVFNYSFNLQSVPLSIIGVSYSSAVFPMLARFFTSGKRKEFLDQMIMSSRHIIFWSIPATVLFIVLRAQIVRVILGSGQFDWTDTRLTAACLAIFAISLLAQSLVLLFIRALYAEGHTKKPMIINLFSSALIVVFGFVLMYFYQVFPAFKYFLESLFKVEDVPGAIVLVLPLAYSLGVIVNTVLHWIAFHREFREYSKPVLETLYEIFSASVIMGYASYLTLNIFGPLLPTEKVLGIFLQGFVAGVVGIIVGIIVLKLFKNKEIEEIWSALHHKIWGTKVIIPEQEQL